MLAPKGLFKGAAYIYMTLPLDKEYSLNSCWEDSAARVTRRAVTGPEMPEGSPALGSHSRPAFLPPPLISNLWVPVLCRVCRVSLCLLFFWCRRLRETDA